MHKAPPPGAYTHIYGEPPPKPGFDAVAFALAISIAAVVGLIVLVVAHIVWRLL